MKITNRCLTLSIVFICALLSACASSGPGMQFGRTDLIVTPDVLFRVAKWESLENDVKDGLAASELSYADNEPNGWHMVTIHRDKSLFHSMSTVMIWRKDSNGVWDIAIRGTNDLDDVAKDIDAKQVQDDILQVPVHAGFNYLARGVYAETRILLPLEDRAKVHVRLYGHSLGGSVANLVAMYLYKDGYAIDRVVTFGAPRFTNDVGARMYAGLNSNVVRIVRCDDPIPFLPPQDESSILWFHFGLQYSATGTEFLLLKKDAFDMSDDGDIERNFSRQLQTEYHNLTKAGGEGAFGHRLVQYRESIIGLQDHQHISTIAYTDKDINYCPTLQGAMARITASVAH